MVMVVNIILGHCGGLVGGRVFDTLGWATTRVALPRPYIRMLL